MTYRFYTKTKIKENMESTAKNFLSHEEICDKISKGEELSPIDRFIHDNEPAGNDQSKMWRTQLFELISMISSDNEKNKERLKYLEGLDDIVSLEMEKDDDESDLCVIGEKVVSYLGYWG